MKKLKTVEIAGDKYDVLVYTMESDGSKMVELQSVDTYAHTEDGFEIARDGSLSTFKRSFEIGNGLNIDSSELESWVDDQVSKLNDPTDLSKYF
jgi:hypothetical protein